MSTTIQPFVVAVHREPFNPSAPWCVRLVNDETDGKGVLLATCSKESEARRIGDSIIQALAFLRLLAAVSR